MRGVGIDITPGRSIVVEVSRSGAQYRLGRSAILPGFTHNTERTAASAAESDFAGGVHDLPGALKGRGGLVSVPGREVMYRMVQMGASNAGAIRAQVRLEVDELTGGRGGMLAGHMVVDAPNDRMLLIGVAREEMVEHLSASLRATGLSASGYVPAPVALYHCYLTSGNLEASGPQLIANIGDASTDIAIVEGANLLAARSIPYGLDEFVSALARSLGVNSEQARETLFARINIKPGVASENISGERAVSTAQDCAAKLFGHLNGSVIYARGILRAPKLDITSVTLCGAGALIPGLPDFLRSRLRKPVDVMNPIGGFDTSGLDEASLSAITPFAPTLAVSLGLARIQASGSGDAVVLEAPSAVARSNFLRRSLWLYLGILVVIGSLVGVIVMASQVTDASAELKKQANAASTAYSASSRELRVVEGATQRNPKEVVAALTPLNRNMLLAEQRLVEIAEARRQGIDGHRLATILTQHLPKDATLIKYGVGTSQGPLGVDDAEIHVFLLSGTRKPQAVMEDVKAAIKKAQFVAEVREGERKPTADGSEIAILRLTFARTAAMLSPAKPAEGGGQ